MTDDAIALREAGRYAEAEAALARRISGPMGDAEALGLLAEVRLLRRDEAGAAEAIRAAEAVDATHPVVQRALARLRLRGGRAGEALASAQAAEAAAPSDPEAQVVLAAVLAALGQAPEARARLDRALSIRPVYAEALAARALVRARLGDEAGALADAEAAVAAKPHLASAWRVLGMLRFRRGDVPGATVALEQAVARDPADPAYLMNLAELQRVGGRPDAARASLHRARELLRARPEARQLTLLAAAFMDAGDRGAAADVAAEALALADSPDAQQVFVEAAKGLRFARADERLRALITRALTDPWGRPRQLMRTAVQVVRLAPAVDACIRRAAEAWPARPPAADLFGADGLAALEADTLLLAALASAPVTDVELEQFLTAARCALVPAAEAGRLEAPAFQAALASQAFINEYVFGLTEAEARAALALRERLDAALQAGERPPDAWILAAAAYAPLAELQAAERLPALDLPPPVAAVVREQVIEPRLDREAQARIPRLTPLRDEVSRKVQDQYEQNPYPRWVRARPLQAPLPPERALRLMFPHAPIAPVPGGAAPEVLVAGCGTGQQALWSARRFAGARVLAVDLSLASLGYASRKAAELGAGDIAFAQADLLELGPLGRSFDVIECGGVLHHLADPAAGLRALTGVLRPGGVMGLGLYSELARARLEPARRLAEAYSPDPDGIRAFRQAVIAAPPADPLRAVLASGDFYSTSACRDLLFHVQEVRFTIPRLAALIDGAGLRFLGFQVEADVLAAYRAAFPQDLAALDLANWARFEADRPGAFAGMYQFWVQKPA